MRGDGMIYEYLGTTTIAGSVLGLCTSYGLAEDNQLARGATVLSFVSAATTAIAASSMEAKNIDVASRYIDSLSDEELIKMDKLLSDKEESL